MNKTYQELLDELQSASERIAELEAQQAVRERHASEVAAQARRELVNMIEWPPARHQADQARQRLEFDRQCREMHREA